MENIRLQRGQELASKSNQTVKVDENIYKVKSQSSTTGHYFSYAVVFHR